MGTVPSIGGFDASAWQNPVANMALQWPGSSLASGALPLIDVPGLSNINPGGGGGQFVSVGAAAPPGASGGLLGKVGGVQGVLGGLETLGKLWGAWQSMKLAKKQFNFTKDITNTNLANQMQAYNTALGDRITSRAYVEGMSPEQANSYLAANALRRDGATHPYATPTVGYMPKEQPSVAGQ